MDEFALPEEHDVLLILCCFFLKSFDSKNIVRGSVAPKAVRPV